MNEVTDLRIPKCGDGFRTSWAYATVDGSPMRLQTSRGERTESEHAEYVLAAFASGEGEPLPQPTCPACDACGTPKQETQCVFVGRRRGWTSWRCLNCLAGWVVLEPTTSDGPREVNAVFAWSPEWCNQPKRARRRCAQ